MQTSLLYCHRLRELVYWHCCIQEIYWILGWDRGGFWYCLPVGSRSWSKGRGWWIKRRANHGNNGRSIAGLLVRRVSDRDLSRRRCQFVIFQHRINFVRDPFCHCDIRYHNFRFGCYILPLHYHCEITLFLILDFWCKVRSRLARESITGFLAWRSLFA